jgi:hypothetical protein
VNRSVIRAAGGAPRGGSIALDRQEPVATAFKRSSAVQPSSATRLRVVAIATLADLLQFESNADPACRSRARRRFNRRYKSDARDVIARVPWRAPASRAGWVTLAWAAPGTAIFRTDANGKKLTRPLIASSARAACAQRRWSGRRLGRRSPPTSADKDRVSEAAAVSPRSDAVRRTAPDARFPDEAATARRATRRSTACASGAALCAARALPAGEAADGTEFYVQDDARAAGAHLEGSRPPRRSAADPASSRSGRQRSTTPNSSAEEAA